MIRYLFIIVIALSLLVIPLPARGQSGGTTYYIAQNESGASDDNSGLAPTSPWLTIQYAADHLQPGDTLVIRDGVYFEAGITFANSGTEDAPITMENYPGESVVIDGSHAEDVMPGIVLYSGQGYYTFDGLTLRNMGWSGFSTDDAAPEPFHGLTLRNIVAYDNGWDGIELKAVDGFLIENVEAYSNGYYGIDIGASADGQISAANGEVRAVVAHDHLGDEGHGIAINQGHDIVIRDSIAYNNTIHGFDVTDWPKGAPTSYNIVVENNLSHDNRVHGFSINSDANHVVFRNNVAWHNKVNGFDCYGGCWHVDWLNNVSVENGVGGFEVEDEPGTNVAEFDDNLLTFHNNITFNNGNPEWDDSPALAIDEDVWQIDATHNIWGGRNDHDAIVVAFAQGDDAVFYRSSDINNDAFQTDNISVNPMLDDDFHLLPDSPAIDAGIDVGLPFNGPAPDIGAFEFALTP